MQMGEAMRGKWDLLNKACRNVCCVKEFFDSWERVCEGCV